MDSYSNCHKDPKMTPGESYELPGLTQMDPLWIPPPHTFQGFKIFSVHSLTKTWSNLFHYEIRPVTVVIITTVFTQCPSCHLSFCSLSMFIFIHGIASIVIIHIARISINSISWYYKGRDLSLQFVINARDIRVQHMNCISLQLPKHFYDKYTRLY